MRFIHDPNQIRVGPYTTSKRELIDLAKAWIAISIAFALVLGGFSMSYEFAMYLGIAFFTVGLGFLLHELAHKVVAQRYGCFAEFRAWNAMLILMLATSVLGIILAAPGAVLISGPVGKRRNGIISVAGPVVNIVLAIAFLFLFFVLPVGKLVAVNGFTINIWLALFNMIPVWNLDGKKVLAWSKPAYFGVLGASLLLFFAQTLLPA